FDLARAGEFGFIDGSPGRVTQGYRQVLVGPAHPYLTKGLPMDFPGVGYGQNDLFSFQARAFLEQVAGLDRLPRVASFAEGLRNIRLLDAVAASAKAGGADVVVD
ncbi:MAG TPA: gfo/Idh/MocA family oxidoreductase, partial [Actinomycetota bacterium]